MDIFKGAVIGYKNRVKGSQSQDYIDYKFFDKCIICAVADGHSTSYFKYSDIGAKLACRVSIEVLEKYNDNLFKLESDLQNGLVQLEICEKWQEYVSKHYKSVNPIVRNTEYMKYSTTLIVALISNDFRLYLKIGDGSVVEKTEGIYKNIIETNNKYIVDSIGREDSHENILYHLKKNNNNEKTDWIILFTDGYENSFDTDEDLYNSLETTISRYTKNIFSKTHLNTTYKSYLNKLSREKSQDDISIMFVGLK
ncbi:MAG: protein phosphatase 2C domain-containing protein [Romboutsia sp.]